MEQLRRRAAGARQSEGSGGFVSTLATPLPQLLDDFGSIATLLVRVNAALGEAMQRADTAWPNRLPLEELLGSADIAKLSDDILLRHVLRSTTVRNVALERLLTSLRAAALRAAGNEDGKADNKPNDNLVEFYCSLARQCFINEYVFAAKPEELAQVEHLKEAIGNAMASGSPVVPVWLSAVAMYRPLHALADAQSLLNRDWQKPVAELLTQQVREPQEEAQLRAAIPRLTSIADAVSRMVQAQYEENPYPRWVRIPLTERAIPIAGYLRQKFPFAVFQRKDGGGIAEVLSAGCGTGQLALEIAQSVTARVLAIDLSLSSLSYAGRKAREPGLTGIEFAQGDLLEAGCDRPQLRCRGMFRGAAPYGGPVRGMAVAFVPAAARRIHAGGPLQRSGAARHRRPRASSLPSGVMAHPPTTSGAAARTCWTLR